MNPQYAAVAARANHRCEYCGAPEAIFNLQFEVEHIIPPGRGGLTVLNNLALACRSCNLHKSDFVTTADPFDGTLTTLYHPRHDRWHEHFELTSEAIIEGKSATGRATIARLKMNSAVQLAARKAWRALGLVAEFGT